MEMCLWSKYFCGHAEKDEVTQTNSQILLWNLTPLYRKRYPPLYRKRCPFWGYSTSHFCWQVTGKQKKKIELCTFFMINTDVRHIELSTQWARFPEWQLLRVRFLSFHGYIALWNGVVTLHYFWPVVGIEYFKWTLQYFWPVVGVGYFNWISKTIQVTLEWDLKLAKSHMDNPFRHWLNSFFTFVNFVNAILWAYAEITSLYSKRKWVHFCLELKNPSHKEKYFYGSIRMPFQYLLVL